MKLIVANIEGVTAPDYRMTVNHTALCPEAGLNLGDGAYPLPSGDTAARDKDKKVKTTANNWIKYTENEEIRVKNLALRRDYIQSQS